MKVPDRLAHKFALFRESGALPCCRLVHAGDVMP
jgi:hypothetical protein